MSTNTTTAAKICLHPWPCRRPAIASTTAPIPPTPPRFSPCKSSSTNTACPAIVSGQLTLGPPSERPRFRRGMWNRAFLVRRLPGPPGTPSGPGERFRAPPWLTLCGGRKAQPPGVAVGGRYDRNGRLRFFGGAAAPDGLRLPPPSLRSWENTKKAKQQSTCECQRVGGIPEVQGVSEVTPYARVGNLVAWRRRAAKNCCLQLFWVNKRPKKNSNNNQPVGCEV